MATQDLTWTQSAFSLLNQCRGDEKRNTMLCVHGLLKAMEFMKAIAIPSLGSEMDLHYKSPTTVPADIHSISALWTRIPLNKKINGDIEVNDMPGNAEDINKWFEHNTQGMISHMIDELKGDEICIYTDAFYFTRDWQKEFKSISKVDGRKNLKFKGKVVSAMTVRMGMDYHNSESLTMIKIPYKGNDNLCALIAVSNNGDTKEMLQELEKMDFHSIWEEEDIKLIMPKFTLESGVDFNPVLVKQGLGSLFSSEDMPFEGLVDGKDKIALRLFIQSSKIEFNAKGTKVGSGTSASIHNECYSVVKTLVINNDFVFGIVDADDKPLFLSVITDVGDQE